MSGVGIESLGRREIEGSKRRREGEEEEEMNDFLKGTKDGRV